ncbi:MAG: hypothetical protein JO236_19610 [Mycobacterium sp.]|uniref:MHYT domain-containing protein n=1 Tax=Mycobacterium sp. TaxID=1785 RepID=UPI001ED4648C|nr:MHYT domain-containing protein [Mycobacterium sp.]MBW0019738.1 hypothetical protein [Mycobacterium sp.]
MGSTQAGQTLVGAVGGLAAGYVVWLAAFSIVDDNATAGQWDPTLLILSGALAVCAVLWGLWQRRRRRNQWTAFAFGVPILPVALSLAVLADITF